MNIPELIKKLPYPDHISKVKTQNNITRFEWRGTIYEITDTLLVQKVRGDNSYVCDNETILMGALLKK